MTRLIPLILALAAAVPLVGCGSGGGNTGTNASSGSDKGYEAALKFSQCMRSHGVAKFPDPQQSSGGGVNLSIGKNSGIDPSSATFKSAQAACRKYAPGGKGNGKPMSAAQQQKFLAFSQCMRSHGVPKFPDPTFSGGGAQLRLNAGPGLDPNSPTFKAAQQACRSKMPGGGPGAGTSQGGG